MASSTHATTVSITPALLKQQLNKADRIEEKMELQMFELVNDIQQSAMLTAISLELSNPKVAFSYYKVAAINGNSLAMKYVSDYYKEATTVAYNHKLKRFWARIAAMHGNYLAAFNCTRFYLHHDNDAEELKRYKELLPDLLYPSVDKYRESAFNHGDCRAKHQLAWMYDHGVGLPRSRKKALELYQELVTLNFGKATFALGTLYEFRTKPPEPIKAKEYYEKAAALNYPLGFINMAYCYKTGQGVDVDFAKAHSWMQKAVDFNIPTAHLHMGIFLEEGVTASKEKEFHKAAEQLKKAAEMDFPAAYNSLAILYENDLCPFRDLAKALEYYKLAAAYGNEKAQFNLGVVYEYGDGVKQSWHEAMYWYEKSANNDNNRGLVECCRLYKGEFKQVKKDKNKLIHFATKLALHSDSKPFYLQELIKAFDVLWSTKVHTFYPLEFKREALNLLLITPLYLQVVIPQEMCYKLIECLALFYVQQIISEPLKTNEQ